MNIYYHVTQSVNVPSILTQGLRPRGAKGSQDAAGFGSNPYNVIMVSNSKYWAKFWASIMSNDMEGPFSLLRIKTFERAYVPFPDYSYEERAWGTECWLYKAVPPERVEDLGKLDV